MSHGSIGARLVVAGTHSGVGKTTVATGLLAALRRAGAHPAGAKIGPDFIDPGYHSVACGRPPRNLDAWICGPHAIPPLAARAGAGCGVLIVEGVMGLFDGAGDGSPSSTADVARLLDAPVVLVIDASALSNSVAAVVHGYATWRPELSLAGVILNRVGSEGHEILLREALEPVGIPVLGALPRDGALEWRDRHLGLVPVAEEPAQVAASLERLADVVRAHVDLEAVMAVARSAPLHTADPVPLPAPGPPIRVGVAAGRAFTFTYQDTLDALQAAGAEVLTFDPLADESLPDGLDGLVIGGGFPEVHAGELSANEPLLSDLLRAANAGLPVWAECGGLLLLCRSLDGARMASVIPAAATMTDRLTLGYRDAITNVATPLGPIGQTVRGHEFHYSQLEPAGEALTVSSRWGRKYEGWATSSVLATYLHHHPGGDPEPVAAFAATCALRHTLRLA
jgi:cobyrinic acid a,c-diamide synthase